MKEDLHPASSVTKSERKKSEFLRPVAGQRTRGDLALMHRPAYVSPTVSLRRRRFHEYSVEIRSGNRNGCGCPVLLGRSRSGEKGRWRRPCHRPPCRSEVVADHERMRIGFAGG